MLFSWYVMSDYLWPHWLQHSSLSPGVRRCPSPSCPSLSPGVCSNSYSLSQWCYLTISSSVTLFFFCLQSFPASGSLPMSQLFPSGCQSIGTSASASVLSMNIQDSFPLRLMIWSPSSSRNSEVYFQHYSSKVSIWHSAFFIVQLSHPYMITGKTIALTRQTFDGKVMSLLLMHEMFPWYL